MISQKACISSVNSFHAQISRVISRPWVNHDGRMMISHRPWFAHGKEMILGLDSWGPPKIRCVLCIVGKQSLYLRFIFGLGQQLWILPLEICAWNELTGRNNNFLRYKKPQKSRGFANFLHLFVIMRESRRAIHIRGIMLLISYPDLLWSLVVRKRSEYEIIMLQKPESTHSCAIGHGPQGSHS